MVFTAFFSIESSETCEAKKRVEQMKNRLASFETKLNEVSIEKILRMLSGCQKNATVHLCIISQLLIEKKGFTKKLEEEKQSTREEYQERLKKELQVTEIEEKLKAETKVRIVHCF